jgi:exportin-2 (importin alpha re-exporter)
MSGDQAIEDLRKVVTALLSPDGRTRREAENYVQTIEDQPGFTICTLRLISLIAPSTIPADIAARQSAAVLFKNVIKRRWVPAEDAGNPIPQSDRDTIKTHLVNLMCSTPPDVQRQLAEAVTLIAKSDFPEHWPTLLPQLVEKLRENNLHVTNGVMLTANSIFKRFRNADMSDSDSENGVLRELDYCLKGFQEPLLRTFVSLGALLPTLEHDTQQLTMLLETIRLSCRVFFSLNSVDIPEYFEDNLSTWMAEFAKYLSYKNYTVSSTSETDPGPIERIHAAIVENIVLYVGKYEEQFAGHLQQFTQLIWQLLVELGPQAKFDTVAVNGIKFLATVSSKEVNISLFNDEILRQIVEQIVVKNLTCTELDAELFEDNPTDYIRKDMEGGDLDTRRRGAIELVRSLLKFFHAKVSALCVGYIDAMLSSYRTSGNWRQKDAALHLLLAVAVVNASVTLGAGTLNASVNIQEAFATHVLPELHDPDVNSRQIVKADAIKLISIFRSHFPREFLVSLMPHLIRHLNSEYVVVQTYAAICIEKFLSVKDNNGAGPASSSPRISKGDLAPMLNPLFGGLFAVLENPELPENDYVIKCIMRLLSIMGPDVIPVTDLLMNKLTAALERVCKNPTNPHFNHYLFECLALLVRSCCGNGDASAISRMESLVFPPFQSVLALDVEEFVPYVFQILAQLLFCRPEKSGLSDAYRSLFAPILSPTLWERKGNVPALVDLFRAYLSRGSAEILAANQMAGVLGVFQKLISARSTEIMGFKLLCSVFAFNTQTALAPFLDVLFDLILRRMLENKTARYSMLVVHSFCVFVIVNGPAPLQERLERMTAGLTAKIVQQIWFPNADYIASVDTSEVNQMIVGGTKLLCESVIKTTPDAFVSLVKCLIPLLHQKNGTGDSAAAALVADILEEEGVGKEFDATYSKLAYAEVPEPQLSAEVQQSHLYFSTMLGGLCRSSPGTYLTVLKAAIPPADVQFISDVMQQNGHSLA